MTVSTLDAQFIDKKRQRGEKINKILKIFIGDDSSCVANQRKPRPTFLWIRFIGFRSAFLLYITIFRLGDDFTWKFCYFLFTLVKQLSQFESYLGSTPQYREKILCLCFHFYYYFFFRGKFQNIKMWNGTTEYTIAKKFSCHGFSRKVNKKPCFCTVWIRRSQNLFWL